MREPGVGLKSAWEALHKPWSQLTRVGRFVLNEITRRVSTPEIPVDAPSLQHHARRLAKLLKRYSLSVEKTLMCYGEEILDRQLPQARIANAAMELYTSSCVLSRRDWALAAGASPADPHAFAADLFLRRSARRIELHLSRLSDNDDDETLAAARSVCEV